MKRMPITSVMSADPTTIQRGQPLSEAYRVLQNAPFHHLPVLDGDTPVGMLSASDILRLAYDVDGTDDQTLKAMLDYQFTIDDAMSDNLNALPDSASVRQAALAMQDGTMHSAIVVDGDEKLVGIVTSTDLIKLIVSEAH